MNKVILKKREPANESYVSRLRKDLKVNHSLYIMFIPVIIYYVVFHYAPIYGTIVAFQDYKPSLGYLASEWVGFKHFKDFLTNPFFAKTMINTLRISLSSLVFEFPAPIILAVLLNELKSARFSKIVQNITYMPHFISLVIVVGMIKEFTLDDGIVTQFLTLFGMESTTLLNQPQYFVPIYIISNIWQQVGWGSIIYLAALTNVDASLIEAAVVDGANKWKQLIHITLPSIAPVVITMLVLKIGSILSVGHEKVLLLYNDLTLDVADVISTYVYRKGLLEQNWSFSTAVNMFNSTINVILLVVANKVSKKLEGTSLW